MTCCFWRASLFPYPRHCEERSDAAIRNTIGEAIRNTIGAQSATPFERGIRCGRSPKSTYNLQKEKTDNLAIFGFFLFLFA